MIPEGFVEVKSGKCKQGDYIVSINGGYRDWAIGIIGKSLPLDYCRVYRPRRHLSKAAPKTAPNKPSPKLSTRSRFIDRAMIGGMERKQAESFYKWVRCQLRASR